MKPGTKVKTRGIRFFYLGKTDHGVPIWGCRFCGDLTFSRRLHGEQYHEEIVNRWKRKRNGSKADS